MLERLDRAFDGQHRFVAIASHELRTPLAINRTLIEVALDDPEVPEATRRLGATLLEVNLRHARLIDGLLVLASSEQRIDKPVDMDLAEVARRAMSNADGAARRAGIGVVSDLRRTRVRGDPALLERVVQNLVDNAIRHNTTSCGWVSVSVSDLAEFAWFAVENTGPLVPPREVDGLFEPFRRLSPGGGGAGLRLSIVRSVVIAHAGQVSATSRRDGGLLVQISLPVNQ
jgi:signal transduction histidine kinase